MTPELTRIDARFGGVANAICCHRLGDVLIDPGPAISIDNVIDALGGEPPRAVLLTHIHLDHAGAAGELAARFPDVEIHLHEAAAPYLIDPARLLASAERVFGPLEPLFGATLPVPEANIRTLADGDLVEGFTAIHTPGHAGTHMAFLHAGSGYAIVGDLAGEAMFPHETVLIPSPPPEIDVGLWLASIDKLLDHRPVAIGLTHFGARTDVEAHFERVREELRRSSELARHTTAAEFEADLRGRLARLPDDVEAGLLKASPPLQQLWAGYARYWKKRAERAESGRPDGDAGASRRD